MVFLYKMLRFQNNFIFMIFKTLKDDKSRLIIFIQVNHKIFRGKDGRFPVSIFFDKMHQQIPVSITTTAGIKSILVSDQFLIHQYHTGIVILEFICISPVSGTLFSVEYAGKGQQERSRAQGSDG